MNAQAEAAATVAIPLGLDFEDFQFANDMLTDDALMSQFTIALFIRWAHCTAAGLLDGGATVGVPRIRRNFLRERSSAMLLH